MRASAAVLRASSRVFTGRDASHACARARTERRTAQVRGIYLGKQLARDEKEDTLNGKVNTDIRNVERRRAAEDRIVD
jgi:hypothetical protein